MAWKEILMTSGGSRARSGPAPDPDSYRSQNRDWIDLPVGGFDGVVPAFPLPKLSKYYEYYEDKKKVREFDEGETEFAREAELDMWKRLWKKPQAFMWEQLGLEDQVAAYVRAFIESTGADSNAGLKTAAIRMEAELGISIAGMKQNLWRIGATNGDVAVPAAPTGKRQTATGSWLKGVNVEGS